MTQNNRSSGLSWWKIALLPWMVLFTWLAYYRVNAIDGFPGGWETAKIIFWHVPMAWLGMIWFFTAAVQALRFLYGKSRGDMELDRKIDVANQIGLVCTLTATATGSIFASLQWNSAWNWDPKEVSIAVLILVYIAYFGLRMSVDEPGLRARLSAVYALIGAVAAPFLMYVIPNLPMVRQLHPPGTTIMGGLDTMWRLTYWTSTIGFIGITTWIYQLRLRTDAVADRRAAAGGNGRGSDIPATGERPRRTEAVRQPLLKG